VTLIAASSLFAILSIASLQGEELKIRAAILILITLVIAPACEQSTAWPPHRAELAHVLGQQKATFRQIEQEMAADGLLRMAPALYAEEAHNPGIPNLPNSQTNKYAALFESTELYLYVTRNEQSTSFEMLIQNDGPRLFLPRFIHTSEDDALPVCRPAMRRLACGACSIRLETDWLLEYSWFPADPEDEARDC
jgi:hypothetical protein